MDGDLSAAQLVDGRLGFVCVNTTTWGLVLNGSASGTYPAGLYMNSCGMYGDFSQDPEGDAAQASAR